MDRILLGLQCSATKTLLASATLDGHLRRCARLPPMALSLRQNLLEILPHSIQQLAANSREWEQELKSPIAALCCGMSGLHTTLHRTKVLQAIGRLSVRPEREPLAVEDVHTEFALSGADAGVAVMISTGFNVLVQGKHRDRSLTLGGWGSELSDRGSGYFIGRRSLSALLDFHDNRRPVSARFVSAIQREASLPSPSQASEWFETLRSTPAWRATVAGLSTTVVRLAEHDYDVTASAILMEAAIEVRASLLAALLKADLQGLLHISQPFLLMLCGGLGINSAILQRAIREAAHSAASLAEGRPWSEESESRPQIVLNTLEPVVGALVLAHRDYRGDGESQRFLDRLKAEAKACAPLSKPAQLHIASESRHA